MGRPLKPCPSDPAKGRSRHNDVRLCVWFFVLFFVLCTWQLMVHAVDRNYLVPLWLHCCENPWALWDTPSSGSAPHRLARTHQPQSTHAHTLAHTEGAYIWSQVMHTERSSYLCTITLKTPCDHDSLISKLNAESINTLPNKCKLWRSAEMYFLYLQKGIWDSDFTL